jgi:hypothetical protein
MSTEKVTKDELSAGLATLSQEIKLISNSINSKLSDTEIEELMKKLKKLSRLANKLKKATN